MTHERSREVLLKDGGPCKERKYVPLMVPLT